MADTVRLEGLEEVIESLDTLVDEEQLKLALGKACALVERSAKQKAPKGETGELRRTITSVVEVNGYEAKGIVFTPLEYAPYVEFGTGLFAESGGRTDVPWSYQDDKGKWHSTSGMKPSPFMRPALHENRTKIQRVIKEALLKND